MFSTSRAAAFPEPNKQQATTPTFMLSLLAACSTSVPAVGKEGERTLTDQISGILQNGASMGFDELNLLYTYKFGFGLKDALRFAGFDGGFQDFIVKQKVFTLLDGQVSMAPIDPQQGLLSSETTEEVLDEGLKPGVAEESHASSRIKDDEDDSHIIDVPAWQELGSRLVQVMGSPDLKVDLFEADSDAPTESTDVYSPLGLADAFETSSPSPGIDSDAESEIDVTGWHSIGCRVAMALDVEDDFDPNPWEEGGSGSFKAVHFASDVEDESESDLIGNTCDASDKTDVKAWADVGSRIAAACNRCHDGDDDIFDCLVNTDDVQ